VIAASTSPAACSSAGRRALVKQALLGACMSRARSCLASISPSADAARHAGLRRLHGLSVAGRRAADLGSVVEMFGLRWQAMIQGIAFMSHQLGSFVACWAAACCSIFWAL